MAKTFLIADTHFGHENICKFTREDGSPLRPWDNAADMAKDMIELWNSTVGKNDKVYCLGDMVMNRRYLHVLGELNGRKVLVKGNHDIFKLDDYVPYFTDIRAYSILDCYLLSHIPVHPGSLGRWGGNFHGHLHSNVVKQWHGKHMTDKPDPRYLCLSVEHIGYRPITLEEAIAKFKEQQ